MVGCFVANIGSTWMGGPANIGQFIATILYIIFWGVFTIMTRKYGVLVKVSFILSLLTFIGAFNSLVMRLLSEGWILAALISAFASVPFYGLRLLMDWTALYAVATVISIVWLIYAGMNLRKHQKSLKNHNHRPCRWFALAPLGPITSRAYRLIEFSFCCMMRPTAIEIAVCRILLFVTLDYLPF